MLKGSEVQRAPVHQQELRLGARQEVAEGQDVQRFACHQRRLRLRLARRRPRRLQAAWHYDLGLRLLPCPCSSPVARACIGDAVIFQTMVVALLMHLNAHAMEALLIAILTLRVTVTVRKPR